jgi:hypothetical protein
MERRPGISVHGSTAAAEDPMASKLEPGDKVTWKTAQGTTKGKVVKKLTRATQIKGHVAEASKDDPKYLFQSDKTGARAANKPAALRKR